MKYLIDAIKEQAMKLTYECPRCAGRWEQESTAVKTCSHCHSTFSPLTASPKVVTLRPPSRDIMFRRVNQLLVIVQASDAIIVNEQQAGTMIEVLQAFKQHFHHEELKEDGE